jgi:drug/metabolite transporter (DMT)-like permease
MKECLKTVSPVDFAAWRTIIGSLSLFLLLVYWKKPLKPKAIGITILIGLLSTTGGIGLVTWALSLGAVGKTAILIYIMPFWVLLLAWPILGEKVRGIQWLSVILAFVGLMIILEPWTLQSTIMGNLLAILCGLSWAASTIAMKMVRQKIEFDLTSMTAWQMFFGAIPLVFLSFSIPSPEIHWSMSFCISLFYSSVICQGIASMLWFYILQELPAGTASMGTLATPVIGFAAAFIQLGERPTAMEGIGTLLILTALIILTGQGLFQIRQIFRVLRRDGIRKLY